MAKLDLLGIVDVETTGLNPTTDEVIELGCILYSLSHNTVLQQVSTLVPVSVDVSPTEHLNGISAGAANRIRTLEDCHVLHDQVINLLFEADAIVAHNAKFDKSFIDQKLAKALQADLCWIDTRAITWPKATRQGCNLVELALCYGVPVWANHRALTDCQLIAHILQREPEAGRLLAKELEPKVWATWRSVASDKEGQAKAKAAGFRWNSKECPANQVWSRRMHPDDVESLPFEVVLFLEE